MKRATDLLKRGALSGTFWGFVVGLGILVLFLLWASDGLVSNVFAAALTLPGLWVFEDLWVKAGQTVPLS